MKIGIDACFYGPRDKGLGRYTENLIKELESIDSSTSGNQYFIFLKKKRWNDYRPENSNFKKVLYNKLKEYDLDLMHFIYFRNAFFYKDRFIVTIHDLILSHVSFLKRVAYKIILKSVIRRAEKIIAVSNYTKQDILKNYSVNPNKIKVIYEGIA